MGEGKDGDAGECGEGRRSRGTRAFVHQTGKEREDVRPVVVFRPRLMVRVRIVHEPAIWEEKKKKKKKEGGKSKSYLDSHTPPPQTSTRPHIPPNNCPPHANPSAPYSSLHPPP